MGAATEEADRLVLEMDRTSNRTALARLVLNPTVPPMVAEEAEVDDLAALPLDHYPRCPN